MTARLHSHFLIGAPGSGKSTLAHQLQSNINKSYLVSTDCIRAELYGAEQIQGHWLQIQAVVLNRIGQALRQGQVVIYDATNAKRSQRRILLKQFQHLAPTVGWVGWHLRTPEYLCQIRNRLRSRQVPETIIQTMSHRLKVSPPSIDEGFDVVFNLDAQTKLNLDQQLQLKLQALQELEVSD